MENVKKWFEAKSEEIPDLGLVTFLCSSLIALSLHESSSEFAIWLVALIWATAYGFYQLGGLLDDIIFQPLYSATKDLTKTRYLPLARQLDEARQNAAKNLFENQGARNLGQRGSTKHQKNFSARAMIGTRE
jgi:hypothetical protein